MKNFYAFLVLLIIGHSGFGFTTENPNTVLHGGTEKHVVAGEAGAVSTITFCNITPEDGAIIEGTQFIVSTEVTPILNTSIVTAEIGYSKTNPTQASDFNSGWTWVTATYSSSLGIGLNDEYTADISTDVDDGIGLNPGVYYYVSRFSVDGSSYIYGGFDGIWDGEDHNAGMLTVGIDPASVPTTTTTNTLTINDCPITDSYSGSYNATSDPIIWVKIEYTASCSRLIIDTESTTGGLDTEIGLYDAYGNYLDEDDDGGTGSLSEISYENLPSGTYYVAAGAKTMTFGADHFNATYTAAAGATTGILYINARTPLGVEDCNLYSPHTGSIVAEETFTVTAQIKQTDYTNLSSGNGAPGIQAWIGYATEKPDNNSDFADADLWKWEVATFYADDGLYDVYTADIGIKIDTPVTHYYISRFSVDEGDFYYGGIHSDGSTLGGDFWDGINYVAGVLAVAPKPEPDNPVLSFTATAISATEITLTWNDNDGTQPADEFLIVGKTGGNSYVTFSDNVEPVPSPQSNGGLPNFNVNVDPGIQTYTVTGLTTATTYDFKIYPYTNSGIYINYKIDDAPEASAMTWATTYTYDGSDWTPGDPSGASTSNDAIVIESGSATITNALNNNSTDDTFINTIIVSPGAGLTLEAGVNLTVATNITLESSSDSYSSLIYEGDGSAEVIGTIKYKRFVNSNTNGNDLISAPLAEETWSNFLLSDTNSDDLLDNGQTGPTIYAFAPFVKNVGDYVNYTSASTETLTSGIGYRAATDNGTTLTFTGTMPPATVGVSVNIEGESIEHRDWNLIGNPFPSYISVSDFLSTPSDETGFSNYELFTEGTGIYGYDGDASNGYNLITSANVQEYPLMAPGQGFLISIPEQASRTENGPPPTFPIITIDAGLPPYTINFTSSIMRTGSSDDYIVGRNANNPLTFFKLKAHTATKKYSTQFYFNEESTQDLDHGYDGKILGNVAPSFALYSDLVQDENGFGFPLALQSLSIEDMMDVVIPLGVNANAGEQLTFSITEMELPSSVEVYLDDNLTNTSTLISASDYVLTPNNNLSGTGRFYLRVSENSALSVTDEDFNSIRIYTQQSPKTVFIQGIINDGATAKIHDIQGRLVSSTTLESRDLLNQIDATKLQDGVYVVTLTDGTQQKSQKVILR